MNAEELEIHQHQIERRVADALPHSEDRAVDPISARFYRAQRVPSTTMTTAPPCLC